jgi:hypothetical protein
MVRGLFIFIRKKVNIKINKVVHSSLMQLIIRWIMQFYNGAIKYHLSDYYRKYSHFFLSTVSANLSL